MPHPKVLIKAFNKGEVI